MTSRRLLLFAAATLVLPSASKADTIQFPSGGQMQGVVLKELDSSLIIHLKHGMLTLSKAEVASISKEDDAVLQAGRRLLPWVPAFHSLLTRTWGSDLRPDPAVVIESGTFKNIPYVLDRSGSREFSIYGDPDEPAGLEIGLSKELAQNADARKDAVAALRSLLSDPKDREFLEAIDLSKPSKADRAGLSFQVEIDKNAKGDETWWITVFSPTALDAIRLSEEEARSLTQAAAPPASTPAPSSTGAKASTPAPPHSPDKTTSQPGYLGFSPGAMSGESSSHRTYSKSGGHYGTYWKGHRKPKMPHPPTKLPGK